MQANEKRARRAALGAILLNMVSMGGYKTISLYLRPLSEALNVQITALTLLFTCQGIISFFVSLMLGKFVKKLGVRKIVSIAAICYGLFYVSLGVAHSVYIIYIGALLFGFASMAGGTAMAHIVITWWYDKGRAQVLSLTNIGLGIFSFVLSPVISSLIGGLGVQNAAMVQGVVSAALMLVIALTLLSEEPSVYGMKPVGYVETSASAKETAANGGSNARRMVATYQFWLILLGSFFVVFVLTGYSSNAAVIYQSMGLTDAQSSWCLSVYSIAALVWAPLFGTLVEKKRGSGGCSAACACIRSDAFLRHCSHRLCPGADCFDFHGVPEPCKYDWLGHTAEGVWRKGSGDADRLRKCLQQHFCHDCSYGCGLCLPAYRKLPCVPPGWGNALDVVRCLYPDCHEQEVH